MKCLRIRARAYIVILLLHSWSTPHITAGQLWAQAGGTVHPLQLPPPQHFQNAFSQPRQRTAWVQRLVIQGLWILQSLIHRPKVPEPDAVFSVQCTLYMGGGEGLHVK
jgi:hypothetical protein